MAMVERGKFITNWQKKERYMFQTGRLNKTGDLERFRSGEGRRHVRQFLRANTEGLQVKSEKTD